MKDLYRIFPLGPSLQRCFAKASSPSPSTSPSSDAAYPPLADLSKKFQAHRHELEPSLDGEPAPYYSPYKPKRQWPPDMSKLSPKHQFRLERKYRRRAALKYARPRWVKMTKIVQWGAITFVILYGVFSLEWDPNGTTFEEIRKEFRSMVNRIFSPAPQPGRRADNQTRN